MPDEFNPEIENLIAVVLPVELARSVMRNESEIPREEFIEVDYTQGVARDGYDQAQDVSVILPRDVVARIHEGTETEEDRVDLKAAIGLALGEP